MFIKPVNHKVYLRVGFRIGFKRNDLGGSNVFVVETIIRRTTEDLDVIDLAELKYVPTFALKHSINSTRFRALLNKLMSKGHSILPNRKEAKLKKIDINLFFISFLGKIRTKIKLFFINFLRAIE